MALIKFKVLLGITIIIRTPPKIIFYSSITEAASSFIAANINTSTTINPASPESEKG
jgi:hypothetical protein